jgi:hypothetical protein
MFIGTYVRPKITSQQYGWPKKLIRQLHLYLRYIFRARARLPICGDMKLFGVLSPPLNTPPPLPLYRKIPWWEYKESTTPVLNIWQKLYLLPYIRVHSWGFMWKFIFRLCYLGFLEFSWLGTLLMMCIGISRPRNATIGTLTTNTSIQFNEDILTIINTSCCTQINIP